jgi:hypothetical protein
MENPDTQAAVAEPTKSTEEMQKAKQSAKQEAQANAVVKFLQDNYAAVQSMFHKTITETLTQTGCLVKPSQKSWVDFYIFYIQWVLSHTHKKFKAQPIRASDFGITASSTESLAPTASEARALMEQTGALPETTPTTEEQQQPTAEMVDV